MDADPDIDWRHTRLAPLPVVGSQCVPHPQGGQHRHVSVVGDLLGYTEQRHNAVADVLVNHPVVLKDGIDDVAEKVVQEIDYLPGGHLLGHGGEVADVREQDGGFHLFAAQVDLPVLQDLFGYLQAHELAEGIFDEVTLLQPVEHLVVVGSELPDFVVGEDRCLIAEISRAGGVHLDHQVFQGIGEGASDPA